MSRGNEGSRSYRGPQDKTPAIPKWALETPADLVLVKQEAIALEAVLEMGQRTARVHVIATYTDQNGTIYTADRIVKMRLKREEKPTTETRKP